MNYYKRSRSWTHSMNTLCALLLMMHRIGPILVMQYCTGKWKTPSLWLVPCFAKAGHKLNSGGGGSLELEWSWKLSSLKGVCSISDICNVTLLSNQSAKVRQASENKEECECHDHSSIYIWG